MPAAGCNLVRMNSINCIGLVALALMALSFFISASRK